MKGLTVEEIGAKIDALGLWETVSPYNWAIRPYGSALPYFCTTVLGEKGSPVKARLLLLEGWQTLHDYVRTREDPNYGVYTSPMEMPHYELIVMADGEVLVSRNDSGYVPTEVKDRARRDRVAKMLWQAYGVMMRIEADRSIALRYADRQAIFARIEDAEGNWSDAPLEIPTPRPYSENVIIPGEALKKAKDLPLVEDFVYEVEFTIVHDVMTQEPRPRCIYGLVGVDVKTGERVTDLRVPVNPELGLKALWESVAGQVVFEFVRLGRVPGELRVKSGRLFRVLRPICLELPLKLSLHDR